MINLVTWDSLWLHYISKILEFIGLFHIDQYSSCIISCMPAGRPGGKSGIKTDLDLRFKTDKIQGINPPHPI